MRCLAIVGLALPLAVGCDFMGSSPDSPDAPRAPAGAAFEGAALCGTHLHFAGFAEEGKEASGASEHGRPIELKLHLAVCGEPGRGGDHGEAWSAIAASVRTMDAVTHDGDEVSFYLASDGRVVAVGDGGVRTIGSVAAAEEAQPVELADGVVATLEVDGEPFALDKHDKDAPDKALVLDIR